MYVPFETLPEHSRIWIYQATRPLNASELEFAKATLRAFCEDWVAHSVPLKTSFTIEHDQFIVLATDEDYHAPSGCSIDSSVKALKGIQQKLGIDLFDRTRVAFLSNNVVETYPLSGLKNLFESGKLDKSTITFDNLVPSLGHLKGAWKTPVEKTWLTKYLPNPTLAS